MSEMNTPESRDDFHITPPVRRRRPQKASRKNKIIRYVLRGTMVFLTVLLILVVGVLSLLNAIFHGPSVAARDTLVRSLSFSSGTWWIPPMFLGQELATQIITDDPALGPPLTGSSNTIITIPEVPSQEWTNYPDGIRIETYKGGSFTAHIMIIRDPSTVYLGTSLDINGASNFTTSIPGERLNHVMEVTGALAGINAGAFNDNGSASAVVGSVPQGLVVSQGKIVHDDGRSYNGFVGFTQDNVMKVSTTVSAAQIQEWGIRDGCCFGPVLIMDGAINQSAYTNNGGWNPRTAIGQRSDGAVIMVCIDGRQINGVGGSYADLIDIMIEYGAVNACNLDGGSSSIMYYRDTYGLYREPGTIVTVNTYSAIQEDPRRMPTFFLVRPSSEG